MYTKQNQRWPRACSISNVVLLPHGERHRTTGVAMGECAMANIRAFAAGEPLLNKWSESKLVGIRGTGMEIEPNRLHRLRRCSGGLSTKTAVDELIFYFCVYMTFIYMPFDLFVKPVAEDHEIWFGFALTGWWAKATAPLHWLIYGLGAYGFRHMKPWMWPMGGVTPVVIAMVVWNFINVRGGGLNAAIISGLIFTVPMVALLRSRGKFQSKQAQYTNDKMREEERMSQPSTLPDWAVDHMNRYLETDGEDGHIWRGVRPCCYHAGPQQRRAENVAADLRQRRGRPHHCCFQGRPCGPSSVVSQSAGVKRRERASGRGQILCEGGTC